MDDKHLPLPPTTTEQEDITRAGQRRINLVWEYTQAIIAILITLAVIYCTIDKIDQQTLKDSFLIVITMYFVRTNHKLIGGTGFKLPGQTR